MVGTLAKVIVISLLTGVMEVPSTMATVAVQSVSGLVPKQIDAVDLSLLSVEGQSKMKALFHRYSSVFSAHKGGLGCTDLIEHEIPLLDETHVRQHYRCIPPSDY